MKKICFLLISILSIFSFTGCTKNNEDALTFKEEYESLNGEINSNGLAHREVDIDENNPFVYITPSEIIEKIENNETFYLYFGSAYCPWCRSVVEMVIKKLMNMVLILFIILIFGMEIIMKYLEILIN
jgi:hypothetical protein